MADGSVTEAFEGGAARGVGQPGARRDIAALLARIDADLPALARELVPAAPSASTTFLQNPDDPGEHKPEWHQFGIVTHTRHFVAALRDQVPVALRRIDLAIAQRVDRYLAVPVGDLTRRDLMLIAGYWHDLGKFTTRTRGRSSWRFIGHADDSARLITGSRPDCADGIGARYGLSPEQIRYVARLAALHYAPMELKLALDRAGGAGLGRDVYREIAAHLGHEGYAVCCHFWADTLAKGHTPRQRAQRPELWDLLVRTLRAVDTFLGQEAGAAR